MRSRIRVFFVRIAWAQTWQLKSATRLSHKTANRCRTYVFNKTDSTRTLKKVQWRKKLLFFIIS